MTAGDDDPHPKPHPTILIMCLLHRRQWLDSAHGSQDGAAQLAEAAAEEAAAAAAMGVRRVGAVEDLRCLDEEIDRDASAAASRYADDTHTIACTEQSGQAIFDAISCPLQSIWLPVSLGFGCAAAQTG